MHVILYIGLYTIFIKVGYKLASGNYLDDQYYLPFSYTRDSKVQSAFYELDMIRH